MTDVTPFSEASTELTQDNLGDALGQASTALSQSGAGDGLPFLKINKQMQWVYGPDQVEIEIGSTWALNPFTLEHGYICWGDAAVLGEEMCPISQTRVVKSTLPQHEYDFRNPDTHKIETLQAKWSEQTSVVLRCMTGADEGTQVLYKTNSLSGLKAMKKYMDELGVAYAENKTKPVAVVMLEASSYIHKTYGKIITPVLNIVSFIGMESNGD